ncbi:hypothetical protein KPATCC21470_6402 [Kitasatospora purpeofusca]
MRTDTVARGPRPTLHRHHSGEPVVAPPQDKSTVRTERLAKM